MLSNLSVLKCIVNGKTHQYICEINAPTHEIKEALFQFIKFVGQFEDAAMASNPENEQKPVEEVKNHCCSQQTEEPTNG
jgi:hypothetical protein